jgi:hypothetical protein
MSLRTILIYFKGGVREKTVGEVLTENNFTDAEKLKLANMTGGELTPEQLAAITADVLENIDLSGKVDKVTGSSLVPDTEAAKIHSPGSDNQDLSGLEPKQSGKSLSTNDLTAELKTNYDTAYSHSQVSHLQFTGLAKITVGTSQPSNPSVGDLWIDTN